MLDKVGFRDGATHYQADAADDRIDLDHILAAVRRQAIVAAVGIAVALVAGIAYLFLATPIYTSSSQILIDMNNVKMADRLSTLTAGAETDSTVASQIQLLQSERMAERVVDSVHLGADAAFMESTDLMIASRDGELDHPPTPAELRGAAIGKLLSNISASRVETTYAIEISYSDPRPDVAAKVAQAYAETYLVDQLESRYEAHRTASKWMESRIAELRDQSIRSDAAVQAFKAQHNLLSTDGKLLTESQLADASGQLLAAETERAKAEAKFRQIDEIRRRGDIDAVVSDALASGVISSMRTKFLEASKLRSEIIPRLGENHEQVVRLTNEMAEYKRLIFDELGRIGESYRSDLEVARAKEGELRERLATLSGSTSSANATQVQLRELEREAQSYRTLYETFLQRLQESKQQESFPISSARVITDSYVPTKPSSPRTLVTLALCFLLGGMAGGGIGAFREFRDRFFRTGDDVRSALGITFLGYIPIVRGQKRRRKPGSSSTAGEIAKSDAVQDYVVDHPFSAAAETLRSTKLAIDLAVSGSGDRKRPIVVGIVSVLPKEGKSTTALNFAELLSMEKGTTLLVDCDLRNPTLSRNLAPSAKTGLVDCAVERMPIDQSILQNKATGLMFLPAGANRRIRNTSEFFSSSLLAGVISQAARCDYVVLDLPPAGVVVDARAVAARVDAFVMVVEWGKTARRLVQSVLAQDPVIARKCVGVILNRADMKRMKRYQSYGSSEFYSDRISAYYKTSP